MKEKREDERRSRDQEKLKMKEKRREKREEMLLLKNVSKPKNPPDELAHNDSKKVP